MARAEDWRVRRYRSLRKVCDRAAVQRSGAVPRWACSRAPRGFVYVCYARGEGAAWTVTEPVSLFARLQTPAWTPSCRPGGLRSDYSMWIVVLAAITLVSAHAQDLCQAASMGDLASVR